MPTLNSIPAHAYALNIAPLALSSTNLLILLSQSRLLFYSSPSLSRVLSPEFSLPSSLSILLFFLATLSVCVREGECESEETRK
jgi:hypothetical protein